MQIMLALDVCRIIEELSENEPTSSHNYTQFEAPAGTTNVVPTSFAVNAEPDGAVEVDPLANVLTAA